MTDPSASLRTAAVALRKGSAAARRMTGLRPKALLLRPGQSRRMPRPRRRWICFVLANGLAFEGIEPPRFSESHPLFPASIDPQLSRRSRTQGENVRGYGMTATTGRGSYASETLAERLAVLHVPPGGRD